MNPYQFPCDHDHPKGNGKVVLKKDINIQVNE